MTKSSRRKDTLMGRHKWTVSDKKCEECNGDMVKVNINTFICTSCGLEQHRAVKRSSFSKTSWKPSKDNPKSTVNQPPKKRLTEYDCGKLIPFTFIPCPYCSKKFRTEYALKQHNRAIHHKPKGVDKNNLVFCNKCNNLMCVSQKKNGLICNVCGFFKPHTTKEI